MLTRQLVRPIAIALMVAAVVLFVLGLIYVTTKGSSLPSFFPGHLPARHTKKGKLLPTHAHTKLGIVLILAAIVSAVGAWWVTFKYEPAD